MLTEIYFHEALELFFKGYGLEYLYMELENTERLKYAFAKFYLKPKLTKEEARQMSLHDICKLFALSNLPNNIKQWAMVVLTDPQRYCDSLVVLMKKCETILESHYEKHADEVMKVHENFDVEESSELLDKFFGGEHFFKNDSSRASVCLLVKNIIRFDRINEKVFFILGACWPIYIKSSINKNAVPDLLQFGKVMSDENRIKIIKMLINHHELFTGEIAEKLNSALPSCFYHLEMMREAKMIKSRSEGRTVFYKLNKSYFYEVTDELLKLFKESGEEE